MAKDDADVKVKGGSDGGGMEAAVVSKDDENTTGHCADIEVEEIKSPPPALHLEDLGEIGQSEAGNTTTEGADDSGAPTPAGGGAGTRGGDGMITLPPGAHHIYGPSASNTTRNNSGVLPGTVQFVPGENPTHPNSRLQVSSNSENYVSSPSDQQGVQQVAAEAYLVEDGEAPPSATVVNTYFGIERKRLLYLVGGSFAILVIVLGSVLGILIPRSRQSQESENSDLCGPLCGVGSTVEGEAASPPEPDKIVFGTVCKDWNFNSSFVPKPTNETCEEKYLSAAYGCGCPEVELASTSCGMLCTDGSDLPNPDLLVIDIHNNFMSCRDWQLKSQFETDPNECVNYNAIGALCGCPNNQPHPDACGTLCGEGLKAQHSERHTVWNTKCRDWDILSTYLPRWYNNENEESCKEYYQDVAYGCACPGVTTPPITCGKLCQDRRICDPICNDGSDVPDPNFVARRESCAGWELQARTEVHSVVCPLYPMTGAMCGCENEPPEENCGPLCGVGSEGLPLPDPDRLLAGQSCSDWDYASRFLPSDYMMYQDGFGGIVRTCPDFFDKIAYGCGCTGFDPPSNGCGMLCSDGSSVPNPTKLVSGRTCRDLEINSLFETDENQCYYYDLMGTQCDCPGTGLDYTEDCFEMDHLFQENRTFYYSSGNSFFWVTFGEKGVMGSIHSNNNFYMLGHFHGIDGNVAKFGGGAPCGVYGPRTGDVDIVEDETTTEPTFVSFYEPSICIARAELRVPKFCSKDDRR